MAQENYFNRTIKHDVICINLYKYQEDLIEKIVKEGFAELKGVQNTGSFRFYSNIGDLDEEIVKNNYLIVWGSNLLNNLRSNLISLIGKCYKKVLIYDLSLSPPIVHIANCTKTSVIMIENKWDNKAFVKELKKCTLSMNDNQPYLSKSAQKSLSKSRFIFDTFLHDLTPEQRLFLIALGCGFTSSKYAMFTGCSEANYGQMKRVIAEKLGISVKQLNEEYVNKYLKRIIDDLYVNNLLEME